MEVDLRSHADGCNPRRPVGYIEGWYVAKDHRHRGIGRELLAVAEDWARSHGCVEMASDTWIDNEVSQRVHEALGYEVVDRCVHYRKLLRDALESVVHVSVVLRDLTPRLSDYGHSYTQKSKGKRRAGLERYWTDRAIHSSPFTLNGTASFQGCTGS
jgi:hypothetical protein